MTLGLEPGAAELAGTSFKKNGGSTGAPFMSSQICTQVMLIRPLSQNNFASLKRSLGSRDI